MTQGSNQQAPADDERLRAYVDAVGIHDERLRGYVEAIGLGACDGTDCEDCVGAAKAAMAVADAEQAELLAENEALKSWLTDARAAMRNMDLLLTEANSDFARKVSETQHRAEAAEERIAKALAALDAMSTALAPGDAYTVRRILDGTAAARDEWRAVVSGE